MDQALLNAQFFRSSTDNLLLQIFIILRSFSNENYLVGGCVRDSLLGLKPKDYDIVTDVSIPKITQAFQEAGWEVTDSGQVFLVTNVSKNGWQFEIANFRKDGVYSGGRRPETVEIGDINDDAHRRDFTVNAIYHNPFNGVIVDPTQKGLSDIENRMLRFIGKPEDRIKEDRLRVFRFYRFLKKGFKADKKSLQACRTMFNESYRLTTPERVREELEKMAGI